MFRRRQSLTIALIIIGGLSAALLAVVSKVAAGDPFLFWLRTQWWYSPNRAWIVFWCLVGIGITVTVWQYLLANRRKSARLKLEIGIVDPDLYINPPTGTASAEESSVLYLLNVPQEAVSIVQCMFRLTNTGEHSIKDVRIQLEYPASYLVDEGTVVLFENVAAVFSKPAGVDQRQRVQRDVGVLEGTARVSYDLDVLRYGETIVLPEPLKIVARSSSHSTGDFKPPVLTARLCHSQNFVDYLRLRAFVFSHDSKLETCFDVFAFLGSTTEDLAVALDAVKHAAWNGEAPQPGYYWTRRRLRTSRLEFCAPAFKIEMAGQLYQEIPLEANLLGISRLFLPSVDFRYTNIQGSLGRQVFRKGKGDGEMILLTRKPPA